MRWRRAGRSRNLEDRRAAAPARGARAGLPRLRLPRGRAGILGLGVVLLVSWWMGLNPLQVLGGLAGPAQVGVETGARPDVGAPAALRTTPQEEELVDFVSFVLDDVQSTWARLLPGYQDAQLVLFRDATQSGCGLGQREMGPFYCPSDRKVYIDLAFFEQLRARFAAPGDFAQAYVLGHEIGHHVQTLTGTSARVRREQRADPGRANALSVRLELQADCLAGVWGHATARRGTLEPGDVEEGLRAAAAIGDDRLQELSGRGVAPESFTHGTSEQRAAWLRRGLESGDPDACNTFDVRHP